MHFLPTPLLQLLALVILLSLNSPRGLCLLVLSHSRRPLLLKTLIFSGCILAKDKGHVPCQSYKAVGMEQLRPRVTAAGTHSLERARAPLP